MKKLAIIYQILKYFFDNQIKDLGINLPKKLASFPGISDIIQFLLNEGYLFEEIDDDKSDKDDLQKRKFRLTSKGYDYLQNLTSLNLGHKNVRANYVKNSLLALIMAGISVDGYLQYKNNDNDRKLEHTHQEQVGKLTFKNYLAIEDTSAVITAEFQNVHNAIDFLQAYEQFKAKKSK